MAEGGVALEFHSVDFFPERWFDLVLVLRTDNTVLYDRLAKRGYSDKKLTENVEAEIMQVVAEEAAESYREGIVHQLPSDSIDDLESNISRVTAWLQQWRADNGVAGGSAAATASGVAGGAGARPENTSDDDMA